MVHSKISLILCLWLCELPTSRPHPKAMHSLIKAWLMVPPKALYFLFPWERFVCSRHSLCSSISSALLGRYGIHFLSSRSEQVTRECRRSSSRCQTKSPNTDMVESDVWFSHPIHAGSNPMPVTRVTNRSGLYLMIVPGRDRARPLHFYSLN